MKDDLPPPEQPESEQPPIEPTVAPTPETTADGDLASERGTELRTFLIADIRGYTTYTTEFGDAAAARLVGRFSTMVREVVEAREGFLLELRGDEALVVFVSARQALRAATELQRRFDAEGMPRGVGIGLDAGEAIPVDDGYRGTSLNVAARLCAQAGPGEILASETVIHLAAKVDGIDYIDPRTLRLKGLDEPVRAVAVVRTDQPKGGRRQRRTSRRPVDRRIAAVGGVGVMVILVGALTWADPLGGLGTAAPSGAASPGEGRPSPTPIPSLAPGAVGIGPDDLPAVAFLQPSTGDIRELLNEPNGAVDAIFADGDFWILDNQPRAIHQIDPETGASERPIAIGFEVSSYAIGDGKLFVAEPQGLIHVFDIASRREVGEPFPFGSFVAGGLTVDDPNPIWDLAYGEGTLWIAGGWAGDLVRMEPTTGEVIGATNIVTSGHSGVADGVALAGGVAWALDSWSGQVLAIDASDGEIRQRAELEPGIGPITAGGGYAWVANGADGTVTRIDELGQSTTYSVGGSIAALAYDSAAGTVWASSPDGGVASIDVLTGHVTQAYLGHSTTSVAADGGRVLAGLARSPAEIIAALPGSVLRVATDEGFGDTDPASSALWAPLRQFSALTCAPLLQRRAEPGPDGELLEPLVAASMPEVSDDRRSYTFTIREGFAFSPPSGEPLTAEAYRHAIERAVTLHQDYDDALPIFDAMGYFDFRDGRSDHISGITVDGDRLTIRLGAPSPTFLERLSLPSFCPVPVDTPAVLSGPDDPPIPRAGPYYISQHSPGEVIILERNPNYPEPSEEGYDAVAYFTERNLGRAIGRWERGELEIVAGTGSELRLGGRTDELWGPGSEAAAAGDQRLWHRSLISVDSLVVNPGSATLSDPDVRRAISLALDRPALSAYWGVPTDEVMPLSMPGLIQGEHGPIDGPHVEEARALLGGRSPELVVVWPRGTWCTECPALGDALKRQLEAVGFVAKFVLADDPVLFANYRDTGYDLVYSSVGADSPDPAWWMTKLLTEFEALCRLRRRRVSTRLGTRRHRRRSRPSGRAGGPGTTRCRSRTCGSRRGRAARDPVRRRHISAADLG